MNCSINLTHHRHTAKWNWVHSIPDLTGTEFTNRVISALAEKDQCHLFEGFQPTAYEFNSQISWTVFIRHQGFITKSVIHHAGLQSRDTNFTSPRISLLPDKANNPFKPSFCTRMKWTTYELTWALTRDLSWIQNAKDHEFWTRDTQDIITLLQRSYLDSTPSNSQLSLNGSLENHVWRPGEHLRRLECLESTLPCTSTHVIKHIILKFYLPYMDAFTLGAINDQRLSCFCHWILEDNSMSLDIPRHHSFMPKLSRFKHISHFLIFADFLLMTPTATFHLVV